MEKTLISFLCAITMMSAPISTFTAKAPKAISQNPTSAVVQQSSLEESDIGSASVEHALKVYGNTVLRLSYSYLHNISDAEDILQDTLLSLMRNKPVFSSQEHGKGIVNSFS